MSSVNHVKTQLLRYQLCYDSDSQAQLCQFQLCKYQLCARRIFMGTKINEQAEQTRLAVIILKIMKA